MPKKDDPTGGYLNILENEIDLVFKGKAECREYRSEGFVEKWEGDKPLKTVVTYTVTIAKDYKPGKPKTYDQNKAKFVDESDNEVV